MEVTNIIIAIGTALGSIYTLKKLFFEKIDSKKWMKGLIKQIFLLKRY